MFLGELPYVRISGGEVLKQTREVMRVGNSLPNAAAVIQPAVPPPTTTTFNLGCSRTSLFPKQKAETQISAGLPTATTAMVHQT